MAVAMAACSDNSGGDGGAVVHSYALTIHGDEWEWDLVNEAANKGYFVKKTLVEDVITPEVYDYGDIEVYIYDGDMQFPLPWTWHKWYDPDPNDPNNALAYYATTVDYAFGPGWIYFFYTNNDFDYDANEPGTHDFRVVTTLDY